MSAINPAHCTAGPPPGRNHHEDAGMIKASRRLAVSNAAVESASRLSTSRERSRSSGSRAGEHSGADATFMLDN